MKFYNRLESVVVNGLELSTDTTSRLRDWLESQKKLEDKREISYGLLTTNTCPDKERPQIETDEPDWTEFEKEFDNAIRAYRCEEFNGDYTDWVKYRSNRLLDAAKTELFEEGEGIYFFDGAKTHFVAAAAVEEIPGAKPKEETEKCRTNAANFKFPSPYKMFDPESESYRRRSLKFWLERVCNNVPKSDEEREEMRTRGISQKGTKIPSSTEDEIPDFTIYHPLKNGDGIYKSIPYSFRGSIKAFSNKKDLIRFLRRCFYDKRDCEICCRQKNLNKK